jgi:acetyl esterase
MTAATRPSPLRKIDLAALIAPDAARSPEMEEVWAFIQAEDAKLPDQSKMTLQEARVVRELSAKRWNSELPEMEAVHRFDVPGINGGPAVTCDLLVPKGATPGCIVYSHGGGWAFGSLSSHARMARYLADEFKLRVLYHDYRLSPEHPFPAPLDDAVAAWRFAVAKAEIDPGYMGPLMVAGDSAGGNLAFATALRETEAGRRAPDLVLSFYGVFGADFETPSYQRFGIGHGLGRAGMEKFLDLYAPGGSGPGAQRYEPLVSPVFASEAQLAKLPPVYLNAAGMDPLMCDTVEMAKRLDAAGATYDVNIHRGVHHGFMQITARLAEARLAFVLAREFAEKHLG